MQIPVVENPRRRRRRMTAKQAKYFGGGRKRRRARRNPTLMAVGNPRRRRRRSSRIYRNPGMPSMLRGVAGDFNPMDLLYFGGGMVGSKVIPRFAEKFITLPKGGMMDYVVRAGATILLGLGVKMLTRSSRAQGQVVAGGLSLILFDLVNQQLLPNLGLSGIGAEYLTTSDVASILSADYAPTIAADYAPTLSQAQNEYYAVQY